MTAPQMLHESLLLEWIDAQAKMVDVSSFSPGGYAAAFPKLAVDANQIQHRATRAKMQQPQLISSLYHSTAQHCGVERLAAVQVADSQDEMIDSQNMEGQLFHGRESVPSSRPLTRQFSGRSRSTEPDSSSQRGLRARIRN